MSAKNRADLITKLYKVAKKEYSVVAPPSDRLVLEHMIYGCCLENSTFDAADEAFAKFQENYFDWNEIRVTTTDELAEVAKNLSFPAESAACLKKTLHGTFEHYYQFDLDFLKKENLSKAVQTFQKFNGVSPFVISYVAQNGLGGHSIPIDRAMMSLFYVIGIVSEDEASKGRVPGLERTIAKAKGVEFFVLVHQLSVAFATAPFSTTIRDIILKINPDAKERFPKRASRSSAVKKKVTAKKTKKEPKTTKKVTRKTKPAVKTTTSKKAVKKPVKKATRKASKKTTVKKTKKAAKKVTKKVTKRGTKTTKKASGTKKSPNKRLAKKKPR